MDFRGTSVAISLSICLCWNFFFPLTLIGISQASDFFYYVKSFSHNFSYFVIVKRGSLSEGKEFVNTF